MDMTVMMVVLTALIAIAGLWQSISVSRQVGQTHKEAREQDAVEKNTIKTNIKALEESRQKHDSQLTAHSQLLTELQRLTMIATEQIAVISTQAKEQDERMNVLHDDVQDIKSAIGRIEEKGNHREEMFKINHEYLKSTQTELKSMLQNLADSAHQVLPKPTRRRTT